MALKTTTQIRGLALDPRTALSMILEMAQDKLEELVMDAPEGRKSFMRIEALANKPVQNQAAYLIYLGVSFGLIGIEKW